MNINLMLLSLLMYAFFSNSADMTLRGRVEAVPNHENEYVFKTNDGKVYPLFRSITGEAIFTDEYVRKQELQVTGRLHADTGAFEVITIHSVKDGKLHEIYYWCETCRIRSTAPGPCWCCFQPFELKEVLVP